MGENTNSSFIDSMEFFDLLMCFKVNYDEAATKLFEYTKKIVIQMYYSKEYYFQVNKNQSHIYDKEDLVQEIYCKILKHISTIINENFTAGRFHIFVETTLRNYIYDINKKAIKTTPVALEESNNLYERFINIEEDIIERIVYLESKKDNYDKSLVILFRLNSLPYIILAYCFNVLIYGASIGRLKRACSSYTAKAIAEKRLGYLRNELCIYFERHYKPISDEAIAPIDEKLSKLDGDKPFAQNKMMKYYGKDEAKSISDWTYRINKSLIKKLYNENLDLGNYRRYKYDR